MSHHADDPSAAPRPRRGFASMDPDRLRAVSSKGGSASRGTAKRGFALMDAVRRREVSLQGLLARRGAKAPPDADAAGAPPQPRP